MRTACCFFIIIATFLGAAAPNDFAQMLPADDDAVRVNVTLNADGSRTAYQFDKARHKATATTTAADGKALGRIVYQMDDAGRFASGLIFGPDKKLLYKSTYKYGNIGRLEEETHLGKDDAVINKIIYSYDAAGRQIGYEVVDASGKLIGRTSSPKPTASPKAKKARK